MDDRGRDLPPEDAQLDEAAGPPSVARHPLLRVFGDHADLIARADRAGASELERLRRATVAADGIARPQFRAQDAQLLGDGLHYETRIAEHGVLATREHNAHDLFNALIWLRHPRLKQALNARQVADIAGVGPKQRTRGQCALTHFDEAGAIVWLADADSLRAWDAHDWPSLFGARRAHWGRSIAVTVFGHALLEHVWSGHDLPVAKALAVRLGATAFASLQVQAGALVACWPPAETAVAAAIADARLLADPQELRPLPLAGIPGWHADSARPEFLREAPCFRPLRPGRRYPAPHEP
jgi:hypothetical protein